MLLSVFEGSHVHVHSATNHVTIIDNIHDSELSRIICWCVAHSVRLDITITHLIFLL